EGETPLFHACSFENENIVRFLVEQGSDIHKQNRYGGTPLFYACETGNEPIVKYLVEQGSDINKENNEGETPLLIAFNHQYETL
ncbi:hypothetical protein PIROE2DRAFT_36401, partial [Piromyces sp. E2]